MDLGAGNGWLCYRVEQLGHRAVALDIRCDLVDGLGAAAPYAFHLPRMFARVAASFDAIPTLSGVFDIAVFNASLHYAEDLSVVLTEAARVVRSKGWIAVLDSPVYSSERHGEAMVEEKRREARVRLGLRAADLMALASVEYLTRERLASASRDAGLHWRRYRVRYPLWYELRPVLAALARKRPPSRFDLWVARRP
ncbi:MAG TPA: methyltransferase domain-containing protein [Gemmatimonadaceae bacterium]|nr:methyltransferase domain-containing protein [Gemmatimonadaceae bacterium]